MRNTRQGATAVLIAVLLPVLLLIVGFSVDLAYMQLARSELRVATDLAAKAASAELANTGSLALARAKGKAVAAANDVAGTGLVLEDADFVFGHTTRSTTGKWAFSTSGSPTNAVQVNSRRTAGSPNGEVPLFFAGLMGGGGFGTQLSATSGFINVDICLVLDRSGSMKLDADSTATGLGPGDPRACVAPFATSRWMAVDTAVELFVARLEATTSDEKIGVVTFASDYTLCGSTFDGVSLDRELTTDMNSVRTTMAARSSQVWFGKTEISTGMAAARAELTGARSRPTAQKIMVVLTDGVYTNADHPSGEATTAAGDGIIVHTITFGAVPAAAINDMVLTADNGNGQHYHAPDAVSLGDVFEQIAGSIAILTE